MGYLLLDRCCDLAKFGRGTVQTNPLVGAVAMSEKGLIVGEGYYRNFGGPHAEINAIKNSQTTIESLIVSLEPCCIHRKTPPCTDAIMREKIQNVVIGATDPNQHIDGRGVRILRENKTTVETCAHQQSSRILQPFRINQTKKRPYIILKWAETADGFLGIVGAETSISNHFSKRLSHKWRSEVDAILVGAQTVIVDEPNLSNRYFYGSQPIRIFLDPNNRIPQHLKTNARGLLTLVYTNNNRATSEYENISLPSSSDKTLPFVLSDLLGRNVGSLLIEGGAKTLQSFIDEGLYDEIRVIRSRKRLGEGISSPQLPDQLVIHQKVTMMDDSIDILVRQD